MTVTEIVDKYGGVRIYKQSTIGLRDILDPKTGIVVAQIPDHFEHYCVEPRNGDVSIAESVDAALEKVS